MKKKFSLTPNEYSILSVMWEKGSPLARNEIVELCKDADWKSSSVHILLNQLLEKEAIRVEGFARTGKNYGRTYEPTLEKEAYELMQLDKLVEDQHVGKAAISKFAAGFIGGEDVDMETLDELEKLILKRKEQLK